MLKNVKFETSVFDYSKLLTVCQQFKRKFYIASLSYVFLTNIFTYFSFYGKIYKNYLRISKVTLKKKM